MKLLQSEHKTIQVISVFLFRIACALFLITWPVWPILFAVYNTVAESLSSAWYNAKEAYGFFESMCSVKEFKSLYIDVWAAIKKGDLL